ncbi:MAG: alpha/beta hydrolase [Bacteroidales bacterium]|nr:alpha/beta hydrolase [Bacteroidales bacterium]
MKRVLFFLTFIICAVSLQAQPADGFGGWQMPEIEVRCSEKFADVDYAGDDQVYHKLDIYLPKVEKESYPVAIHIYGSAWFSNNSKGMADLGTIVNALLDAGYAVVTPNHRSSMDAKFPAQIHDIKAVVRFVRGNADKYKFDTDFIVTSGFSSGAHLASLAATSCGVAELEGSLGDYTDCSSLVDAACCWSGPTDLHYMSCGREVDDWNHGPEEAVMGFAFKGNEEAFKALNATTYIDPSDPPIVVFHGTADNVVPMCQGEHFHKLLKDAGVVTELHIIEGGGHGMGMYAPENLEAMVSFLEKVHISKRAH